MLSLLQQRNKESPRRLSRLTKNAEHIVFQLPRGMIFFGTEVVVLIVPITLPTESGPICMLVLQAKHQGPTCHKTDLAGLHLTVFPLEELYGKNSTYSRQGSFTNSKRT